MTTRALSEILPEPDGKKYQFNGLSQTCRCAATLIFILLIILNALPAGAQAKHPLSPDEAIRIARLGDMMMTPNGEQVFYSEARLDWDKNTYEKTFYIIPFGGGTPQQFIGKSGGEDFRFSPDGKNLSFLRKVDKEAQLFLMPVSGGEALQKTRHKGGIQAYEWAGNSRWLCFAAEETMSPEEEAEWEKGADAYGVDEGPNGKVTGRWRNLWMFDLESGKEARLTNEKWIVDEFDVSPDGRQIVFSARPDNRQNYPHHSELYVFDRDTKMVKKLTDNRAPERLFAWSPDGTVFLYQASDDKEYDYRNGFLWIMNPETGENRKLTAQNQGEIDHVVWTPDGKSLLLNEVRGTNTNLFRFDLANDAMIPITEKTGTLRALAYSEDRKRMVYSFSDFNTPEDIYASDIPVQNAVRLTWANPRIEKEVRLGKGEVLRWKSMDGTEIEGVFIFPVNHQKGQKAPLILDIHGGPNGYWGNEFNPFFQVYAGVGYAVLGVNVRGSSGYGDDIMRGLIGDVGGAEFEDLMTGVDHVIGLGHVDPNRMGVKGWSWGGVSCGWVVTHTDRFKAASCGAGVFSWQAESGPGFNYDVSLWFIGGNAWENPEEWRNRSSLTYVKNVKTPTLLLHGSNDITSSTNQSMVFYTALRDLNVPTRFIKFPRQGHQVREPRLRRILMIEEIKWMQKHIFGKEWNPPEAGKDRKFLYWRGMESPASGSKSTLPLTK